MPLPNKFIDTSGELFIYRYGSGVKLIRPDKPNNLKYSGTFYDRRLSIDSLLRMPFAVYLENVEHITISSNEITAKACGFASLKDFIGKPAFNYFKKETILNKLTNHKKVLENNIMVIAEESALRQDDSEVNTLSVRMPWYNDNNKIIGLFGCSIILGKNPLAESLTEIAKLGLLDLDRVQHTNICFGSEMLSVGLSKREVDCLRLTVRGKPAKQVAYELRLSQRTVEQYLDNIKRKMNVSSKAALIERGVEYFFNTTDSDV